MRTGPEHCLSLGMDAGHKGYDKSSPSVCPSNENATYSIIASYPRLTFMVLLQETRMSEHFLPRIEFFAFHHLLLQGLSHRSCVDCGGPRRASPTSSSTFTRRQHFCLQHITPELYNMITARVVVVRPNAFVSVHLRHVSRRSRLSANSGKRKALH